MILSGPVTGELKRLRARAGAIQTTFRVPPNRAVEFAAALLSDGAGADAARLVIADVVFPPRHLNATLARHDPEASLAHEMVIDAGPGEGTLLLSSALSDSVDFWFDAKPGGFLLFADHDEYSTVFAHRQGAVSRAGERLRAARFDEVPGYER